MALQKPKPITDEGDEPNLTPLVDCVFLLLIFFMVTTVFIHAKGLLVDLPGKAEAEEQQTKKKDINIVVDADGTIEIAGETVDRTLIGSTIQKLMVEYQNENIIIQGDRETPHYIIVYIMDEAKKADVKDIAFATVEVITEAGATE